MTLMVAVTTLSINKRYPAVNHMDYETHLDNGDVLFATGHTFMDKLSIDQTLSVKARMAQAVRNGRGHIKCERDGNWVIITHTYKYWVKGL